MADSENSRTLPSVARGKTVSNSGTLAPRKSINGRNLYAVARNLLASRTAELRKQRADRPPGPTPAAELWQKWLALHQQRERMTRFQQKLEGQVLADAGGFPVVTVVISDREQPISVNSFTEIERLKPQLNAEQLTKARSELRRRRKQWREADKKLGYSAALAFERDLAAQEQMLARVLWLAAPRSLAEVIAKLHCLLVMEDPGMRHKGAPWPELRTILGDLVHIEQRHVL
jgi:hypothetical protein